MPSPLGLSLQKNETNNIGAYKVINNKNIESLFGNSQFSPFPSNVDAGSANVSLIRTAQSIHSDSMYDISVKDIVDYTQQTGNQAMKLSYADFAYLRSLGVFPNNRLMIARRFSSAVGNDLTAVKSRPLATLISWVPDDTEFINISFGEEWTDAEASLTDVLNDIGKDMKASAESNSKVGSAASAAFNILPLPGFMEGLQYEVMKKMGITDAGVGNSPLGNPNLIRMAKRRTTVGKEQAGSGLRASVSVSMVCEYEQKFINGVDPTLVYLDIIQNALTFGTSDAAFQFNANFGQGVKGIIGKLISGDLGAIFTAMTEFVQSLLDALMKVGQDLIKALVDPPKEEKPNATDIFNTIKKAFQSTVGHVISKYKVRLLGIANALTGSGSTPWHITIGNPKKPLFSSGDMLCADVKVTLGKILAFNDLPSSIKIEFTLTNARPLGASEIFNRFNTGKGRSYARLQKSFVEEPDIKIEVKESGTQSTATINQSGDKVSDTYFTQDSTGGVDWLDSGNPSEGEPVNVSDAQRDADNNLVNASNTGDVQPSAQSPSSQPDATVSEIPPEVKEPDPQVLTAEDATKASKKGYVYRIKSEIMTTFDYPEGLDGPFTKKDIEYNTVTVTTQEDDFVYSRYDEASSHPEDAMILEARTKVGDI